MPETSKHDAWSAGEAYDAYMGRWSRKIAPLFLDRIGAAGGLEWLDVGCGTGALTEAILSRASPSSVLGIDASDGFVERREAAGCRPPGELRGRRRAGAAARHRRAATWPLRRWC